MYQRTVKLLIGPNAWDNPTADDLLQRLVDDRLPTMTAANGFVAFYAVRESDSELFSTRIFNGEATLQAESDDAFVVIDQIRVDFDLSSEDIIDGEVGASA